jgi:hypothetical protein
MPVRHGKKKTAGMGASYSGRKGVAAASQPSH